MTVHPRRTARVDGFTLLELVVALTLFAFLIIVVLADRETSIDMSADARVTQIVRYLAALKIDEVRHDPEEFGDSDSGDFEDLNTDWQDFSAFSWDLEIEQVVVIGGGDDEDAELLYQEDDEEDPVTTESGEEVPPRYARRLVLTVRYEPEGLEDPGLSIQVETYLPPLDEEEDSR